VFSDAPEDGSPSTPDEPLIFVSDASAEAERLMAALRNRGYAVVDVSLALLVGRVAVQRPALILCDVDAPGALDQVKRLRDVPGGSQVDIVFFGDAGRTLDALRDEVFHESSGFFVRPVDTFGLLRKVEALIGPPSGSGGHTSATPPSRPPSALSRPSSSPEPLNAGAGGSGSAPSGPGSLLPAHSSAPPLRVSSAPPGEPALPKPIPLGFAGDPDAAQRPLARNLPQSEISPELEGILARAERRVGGSGSGRSPPSLRMTPEAEVEAVLPADVLAALDEPLDVEEEDDDPGTGHGTSTGGSARTGLGTGVGTTGGGISTSVGTASGTFGSSILTPGPSIETGAGAAGPTAPPPRRNVQSEPLEFVAPRQGAEEEAPPTPPAIPTRPPEPPSWPPPAPSTGSQQLTNVEPKPMSLRTPGDGTAALAQTPMPPAPTPEGTRLPRPTTPAQVSSEPGMLPPQRPAPPTARAAPATPEIPPTLGRGDAAVAIARAVRSRFTGALAFENEQGIRRVVLRDGDFVTTASGVTSETLVAFLTERGTLGPEVIRSLGHKLPPFGRHAGAALIAHGHLRQDELWPVLRAHAEWLVGRVIGMVSGGASIEKEVPARLQAEPAVFGGATGAEVFVEVVRRVVSRDDAIARIGGRNTRLVDGAGAALLGECALSEVEVDMVNRAKSNALDEMLQSVGKPDFASVLYALCLLGVVDAIGPAPASAPAPSERRWDPLDDQAVRTRILARKALVEEGDYFALLGLTKNATSYDVQRAYNELRHDFEPSRILTAATANLRDEVDLILEVLDEAYDILRDQLRRDRYRRALEASPR
jgi:hypothetical protein